MNACMILDRVADFVALEQMRAHAAPPFRCEVASGRGRYAVSVVIADLTVVHEEASELYRAIDRAYAALCDFLDEPTRGGA